ncbi:adenosine deaminase 2 isoform X2 [Drosophila grimshawi]|uniref:adenosine deaminase 2 isoform X2 n=1 Tax=Drosophila grimshawi TaxID=7222 RepID=UPI000C870309|nr:adenosine deaminase 2 isoform X2 [Drosophila grimshawi]
MAHRFYSRQVCRAMSVQAPTCDQIKYQPLSMSRSLRDITPEAYSTLRNIMVQLERNSCLGHAVQLNEQELAANKVIKSVKTRELKRGIINPANFTACQHIFQVLKKVERSPLFGLLRTMPKGGILHAHDTALCSTEFLISLTYRKDLWICTTKEGCRAIAFRFSKTKPELPGKEPCNWEPMSNYHGRCGDKHVNRYLHSCFSMYPFSSFLSNNEAWNRFMSIFSLLDGLLLYAPIWADYYYNALKEMHEDGVQYLELRSLLPELYCLDGRQLTMADTVAIYKSETERFVANHPDFIGAKLIYAPLRGVEPQVVEEYVEKCVALKFPTFLAGFDLVGQEELGRPLLDFAEPLLKMPEDINFYFHAGETNWFGTSIDENLIDAILLGTKRIGHGYAIVKHPVAIEMVKKLNIAIEVCPVSNQVLQLGQDYRTHPAAMLIANDVPIVIASDDPSFWLSTPLTHDFYFAFLGIAPYNADLKLLKHLAMSSISYSSMTDAEKSTAMGKWQEQWEKWITSIAKKA